jgi:alkanesulfonate monooxygenase SsuD/methylene tetrahydromethanopterin reductase-like flavin-dependent oxidoreductase (luciferase family)
MLVDELEILTRLFRSDEPVSYEGQHFSLHDAVLLPRPQRAGGPTILIGGNGEKRTMPLAARYAGEWNTLFLRPERFREKNDAMDELLAGMGRSPETVRRSLMVGTIFAPDERSLGEKLARHEGSVRVAQERGIVAGTPPMWVEQLRAYRDVGVQRIMLQWLEQDSIEGLEIIARDVLPQVAA